MSLSGTLHQPVKLLAPMGGRRALRVKRGIIKNPTLWILNSVCVYGEAVLFLATTMPVVDG